MTSEQHLSTMVAILRFQGCSGRCSLVWLYLLHCLKYVVQWLVPSCSLFLPKRKQDVATRLWPWNPFLFSRMKNLIKRSKDDFKNEKKSFSLKKNRRRSNLVFLAVKACEWSVCECLRVYRAFHGFGQAKFPDGGLVLGSSQLANTAPATSKNNAWLRSG